VDGVCDTYREASNVHRLLLGKPEGKRPLGGPRHSRDDNITYIVWKGVTGFIFPRMVGIGGLFVNTLMKLILV
jgi:hypothetical protein